MRYRPADPGATRGRGHGPGHTHHTGQLPRRADIKSTCLTPFLQLPVQERITDTREKETHLVYLLYQDLQQVTTCDL